MIDTATGARVGFLDAFGSEAGNPTLFGTYPGGARTALRPGIQRLPSGLFQITATDVPGKKYELQQSQELVDWDRLVEFQVTASPTSVTDPDTQPQTHLRRFYRLISVQ